MVGRKAEQKILSKYLSDRKSAVLMVSGRYRVGKTTFIRETCRNRIAFEVCGIKNANLTQQLVHFNLELSRTFPGQLESGMPGSWEQAFARLSNALDMLGDAEKKVVFFDELSWLDGKRSGFQDALAEWWLEISSTQDVLLVLSSSDVAWMQKVHNIHPIGAQVSALIHLRPFTLLESREFVANRGVQLTNYQLVLLYMVLGGIPYYLEQIQPDRSAGENIQALCFDKKGTLRNEFTILEQSVFDSKGISVQIFKLLVAHSSGLTRRELLDQLDLRDGGWLSELLLSLEVSGFICSIQPLERRKKATIYRMQDAFVGFYLNFILSPHQKAQIQWNPMQHAELYRRWSTYAFENVCMVHLEQIRQYMGIAGIETRLVSLVQDPMRLDLLLDRADGILQLFRCYFFADTHTLSPQECAELKRIGETLPDLLRKPRKIRLVSISTYGLAEGDPAIDTAQLGIECLFEALK